MNEIKKIKSLDIESVTVLGTAIQVVLAILLSLILIIVGGIINVKSINGMVLIALTLIFGTLIYSIFLLFTETYLYNVLVKKLQPIKFTLTDNKEITKIDPIPVSILMAIITVVIYLIVYLMSVFIVPFILSSMMQTLVMTGQMGIAMLLYQLITYYSNPIVVGIIIFGAFIGTFISVLISVLIYNFISPKIGGIVVEFSNAGKMTVLESINPLKIAIIFGAVALITNLISGIITAIGTKEYMVILSNPIAGFIGTFISVALFAVLYNVLSKKLGKIKVELVNE